MILVEELKRAAEELNRQHEHDYALDRHFVAYVPRHEYICTLTGAVWSAAGINSRFHEGVMVPGLDKPMRASDWLDRMCAVDYITWLPGEPQVIEDKYVSYEGTVGCRGFRTYNTYRPTTLKPGDARAAGKWIDHVRKLYPAEADHLINWLAARVQNPADKPTHSIVLGGKQGIGKDMSLIPIAHAIGISNCQAIAPAVC
jgi:hypothetical protein